MRRILRDFATKFARLCILLGYILIDLSYRTRLDFLLHFLIKQVQTVRLPIGIYYSDAAFRYCTLHTNQNHAVLFVVLFSLYY
jgi:hypothetical protein